MAKYSEISRIFILLGGILGLLLGILTAVHLGWNPYDFGLMGVLGDIVLGAIQIIISLIVLATSDVVNIKALKAAKNWITYLVLGIIMLIFLLGLPGILVIIGAILLVLK